MVRRPEASAASADRGLLALHADDEIDAGELHAIRDRRQARELHVRHGHVDQLAAVDVVKVIVRRGIGVEPRTLAVDAELPDETLRGEQIQGVIDRRFGHVHAASAQARQDLLGGKVLIGRQEERRDLDALRRGADSAIAQLLQGSVHRLSINQHFG